MQNNAKLLASLFVTSCALCAQVLSPTAESPNGALPKPPQFVILNVVAFDSHNQPVSDLSAADLQIQDQGKRQQVLFFRRLDGKPRQPVQLGSHELSNRLGPVPPQTTVILLDLLNANLADRGSGWDGINRTLQHMESGDNLYLYLLTADARIYPVHGLPGTEAPDAPAGSSWTQQIRPLLEHAINAVNRLKSVDERDPMIRVRQTYDALGLLASQFAPLPGRKNIVWITHGVPLIFRSYTNDIIDMTGILRQFCANFTHAGVVVYSVDQGGPGTLPPGGSNGSEGPGYQSQDTLQSLADLTGGHAYPGNNVESAVTAALMSAYGSYQVVYNPPAQNWDSKFHKLHVSCTRKGIRIQTLMGYTADPASAADNRLRARFGSAVQNPMDAADIGLSVSVSPGAAPHSFRYELHIDPADLLLLPQGDHDNTQLAIAFIGIGAPVDAAPVIAGVSLTREQQLTAARDGIPFSANRVIPEGVQKVRIVVADLNSSRIGTLTLTAPKDTRR